MKYNHNNIKNLDNNTLKECILDIYYINNHKNIQEHIF